MNQIIETLLSSEEPSIRYKIRVGVLSEDPESRAIRNLQAEIKQSPRVKSLLQNRDERGRICPVHHPYKKWIGAHWVLTTLADIGYPPGDKSLIPIRDQVFECWLNPDAIRERVCTAAPPAHRDRVSKRYAKINIGVMESEGEKLLEKKGSEMRITHLKCREIQAPIVSSLIHGFAQEIGYEKTMEIAKKVISKNATRSGKKLAHEYSGNTIAELSKIVKEVWAKDDAMKIEIIRENDKELFFDVTYCGYAEMYEKMGIKELGSILSCSRDFPFMEGFNPDIKLTRTKTIMEGAEYCDFRYQKKIKVK
jgi:hypothetical protein